MKLTEKISKFFNRTHNTAKRVWKRRHVFKDLMKHKHRFVVLDTNTYKEKISFQLSGLNIFVFLGITGLVLVFLTAILLAFTPLRELIPGYSNTGMVEQTYENARIIDSLETELKAQEEMLADIQYIMLGKDPAERHNTDASKQGDTVKAKPTPYTRSKADSLMRQEVEERERKK
ncbi:MAG: hypothetical protein J6X58_01820 [Bacteroidales bacterium]|nr:hypothetical protein [Bacteroidales bacterium]